LEISKELLEDKSKRAMKGEDVFQDVKVESWKLDSNIIELHKEILILNGCKMQWLAKWLKCIKVVVRHFGPN
jgi:hypothetical protein